MKQNEIQQIEFSSVFFDTLFGLVLFFSLDSFLDIKGSLHFIFYLFTIIILVHWWLVFKSSDDVFGEEVSNSTTDLLFGIIYVILIEYVILYAKVFDYQTATVFLLALLVVDLTWALVWRFVGEWRTKDKEKIATMERELENNMKIDFLIVGLFLLLVLVANLMTPIQFVSYFIIVYLLYIGLMFKFKIIDLRIF